MHKLEGHDHVLQKVHLQMDTIDLGSITCHFTLVHLLEGKIFSLNMFSRYVDPIEYWCMVGKLLHIIHTRLDICYVIGLISHYIQVFQYSHFDVSNIFFNISREPKTLQFAIEKEGRRNFCDFVDTNYFEI